MSEFRMVDVGEKPVTAREAVARGEIVLSKDVLTRIREGTVPKGDVLRLAEVAAILGVKSTAEILPLCHPLAVEGVKVECKADDATGRVVVTCSVRTHGKTGVEMEALCGVSAALLCVYDLTKALDKGAEIGGIRLLEKRGGQSGHYVAGSAVPSTPLEGIRAGVLTVSDRASEGRYEDRSGPAARKFLATRGALVVREAILPDKGELLRDEILQWVEHDRLELIVLSGGTGVSPRDVTPEVLQNLWTRGVPGIGELLRSSGALHTPYSWLSRCDGGFVGNCLVILLPGSPNAVEEGLVTLEKILPHALRLAQGGGHD